MQESSKAQGTPNTGNSKTVQQKYKTNNKFSKGQSFNKSPSLNSIRSLIEHHLTLDTIPSRGSVMTHSNQIYLGYLGLNVFSCSLFCPVFVLGILLLAFQRASSAGTQL